MLTPTATPIPSIHYRREATSSTPLKPEYTENGAIAAGTAGTSNAQLDAECSNGGTHSCPNSSNKRGEKKVPMNEGKHIEARKKKKSKQDEAEEKEDETIVKVGSYGGGWRKRAKRQGGVDPLDPDIETDAGDSGGDFL